MEISIVPQTHVLPHHTIADAEVEAREDVRPCAAALNTISSVGRLSKAEIQRELDRILTSDIFRKAENLQRLLQFIVLKALAGQAEELKQYVLGVEVFGRHPSFDPRTDPIVRIQAGRLRAKLREYYMGKGCMDPYVIEVPRGSYVPLFHAQLPVASMPPSNGESKAVAVIPFINLLTNEQEKYLADALTEDIIDDLIKSKSLRVIPWIAVMQFKKETCDVRELAERFGVQYVLEGSIRRIADTLRVKARLFDISSQCLWRGQYHYGTQSFWLEEDTMAAAIVRDLVQILEEPREPQTSKHHLF
jgi:TolB-like protein